MLLGTFSVNQQYCCRGMQANIEIMEECVANSDIAKQTVRISSRRSKALFIEEGPSDVVTSLPRISLGSSVLYAHPS